MTFSYVAVLACYGRLPLSRFRVSEVCMEHSISSNTIWYAQNLPLMRRTGKPGVSPAFTRRKKACMLPSSRKYTSCSSLPYTQHNSGSYRLLSCRVFLAAFHPGHFSPARRRITHQLERPRHLPCMNSRVAASCPLTSILIFLLISMSVYLSLRWESTKVGRQQRCCLCVGSLPRLLPDFPLSLGQRGRIDDSQLLKDALDPQ